MTTRWLLAAKQRTPHAIRTLRHAELAVNAARRSPEKASAMMNVEPDNAMM
jgi:hypothetical protein